MNIAEKLLAIQTELKAPKNQRNKFGNYNYRSAEDILEALKPYLKKHKATVKVSNITVDVCGLPTVRSTAKIIDIEEPNSSIEAQDDAIIEVNAKGMQMPQKSGAASSYAKKYALGNLFLLDDTKDPDATNNGKPDLLKGTNNFDRAVKYLQEGGDITKIIDKYNVAKEELEELTIIKQQENV